MGYASTQVDPVTCQAETELLFQLYNHTLTGFLGASYVLSSCTEFVNLVGLCILYYYIWKNEKKFGPLGEREEATNKELKVS